MSTYKPELTPRSWTGGGLIRGVALAIFDGAQSVQFQADSVLVVVADIAPQTYLQFVHTAELVEVAILRFQRPEEVS